MTKWSNTLKQFVGKLPKNSLSVFDHFVELALKELRMPMQLLDYLPQLIERLGGRRSSLSLTFQKNRPCLCHVTVLLKKKINAVKKRKVTKYLVHENNPHPQPKQ